MGIALELLIFDMVHISQTSWLIQLYTQYCTNENTSICQIYFNEFIYANFDVKIMTLRHIMLHMVKSKIHYLALLDGQYNRIFKPGSNDSHKSRSIADYISDHTPWITPLWFRHVHAWDYLTKIQPAKHFPELKILHNSSE